MKHFLRDFRFMVKDWFASRGERVRHDDGMARMLRDSTHARGMSNGFGRATNDRADRILGTGQAQYVDSFDEPDAEP